MKIELWDELAHSFGPSGKQWQYPALKTFQQSL
jgi:hypothetical protein